MVKNEIINREEQELYTYGLQQGFVMLFNIIITIVVGLFFGMVLQSIILMVVYIPVRIYAGGYHARTQLRCYMFSILMISFVLSLIKLVNWTGILCLMIAVSSIIVIFYLAPVADANKPLDVTEKKIYKGRARILTVILLCIGLLCWFLDVRQVSVCIVCALAMESIMLLLGIFGEK